MGQENHTAYNKTKYLSPIYNFSSFTISILTYIFNVHVQSTIIQYILCLSQLTSVIHSFFVLIYIFVTTIVKIMKIRSSAFWDYKLVNHVETLTTSINCSKSVSFAESHCNKQNPIQSDKLMDSNIMGMCSSGNHSTRSGCTV